MPGMIYATLLPTGLVKIGRGTRLGRAYFAQVYFLEEVKVLALWETENDDAQERRALAACRPFRVRAELHQGDPTVMLAAITEAIGPPSIVNPPKYGKGRPRRGEVRIAPAIAEALREKSRDSYRHFSRRKACDLI